MGLSVCTVLLFSKCYECCNLVLDFLLASMWAKEFHISYSKTCIKRSLSKRPKIGFQDQLSLNVGQMYCRMHSAILLTFIKLPFVIKIFVLSIFEWRFYTKFYCIFRPNRISRPTL